MLKYVKHDLLKLRKKQRYSQAQLAEEANVSRQTINRIENDKYDPSLGLAFQLADILGVTVDELFINKLPVQSIETPTSVSAMGIIEFSNLIIISQWAFAFADFYLD
ncbi:helix-turn-helix transcriptional regulator [Lactobacillus sp. ESL0263]|uniref:helix-turn-helix transcriptional regulator n=1 Tax=Lactobacillus sp. ESL0263 TaxID=2069350 RepID=UPI0026B28782